MTIQTSVTELALYVQRHRTVPRIGQSIVIYVKVVPELKMFSESFDSQSERQGSLSVETSIPKL